MKESLKEELDKAVECMDMEKIEKLLAEISERNPMPIQIEDSKLFAKKIISCEKKGNDLMKKTYRKVASFAAGIAVVAGIGVTSYATGMWRQFDFFEKDKTMSVRSNTEVSKEEAKQLINNSNKEQEGPTREAETKDTVFNSLEEVKKELNVDVVIPSYVPQDFKQDKEIKTQSAYYGEDAARHLVYVTYASPKNEKRLFGITITKIDATTDYTAVNETDATYTGKYDSKNGNHYTLLKEEEGTIATTNIGDVEYSLVFVGVDEKEMHKIIDSTDLSVYK
ncbi:MAG: hypothetical protein AB9856_14155 [Cellulosilyticaceae bacterium]